MLPQMHTLGRNGRNMRSTALQLASALRQETAKLEYGAQTAKHEVHHWVIIVIRCEIRGANREFLIRHNNPNADAAANIRINRRNL